MDENQKTHNIELDQDFQVSVEELFKAWTEADHLKEWWHPMDDSLEDVKNELQEGGAVEYHFAGRKFDVKGNYKEVKPNEKLVYTWDWEFEENLKNESFVLTITFESNESGSRLHVKQEGFRDEQAVGPHEEAWKKGLEDLKAHLEKSSSSVSDSVKSDEGMNDRSGGYNELPEQAKVGGA
ncbi:SRPBCC domain-containing protein [Dyadobacter sp. NIV53]|uniref:SRPBCC family protein n=1 Tax=Dyadobacter sp. NIV53 TaxID=2861765 RepID=UPI001C88A3C3|nr:SRPBCC domain-containing protein [Dyadobacter sp. NIV53]